MNIYEAIKNCDINAVKYFYNDKLHLRYLIFEYVCKFGNLEIIQYFLKMGIDDYDIKIGFLGACEHNNFEVVKFLYNEITKFTTRRMFYGYEKTNLTMALSYACLNNDLEIVKFLIEKGAKTNFGTTFYNACKTGNLEIIDYILIEKDYKSALEGACSNNNLELVKYIVEKGANNFDNLLRYTDSLELSKYLVEKGARDFNAALLNAIEYGNIELIDFLIEKGANNIYEAISIACKNKNSKIVKHLSNYLSVL